MNNYVWYRIYNIEDCTVVSDKLESRYKVTLLIWNLPIYYEYLKEGWPFIVAGEDTENWIFIHNIKLENKPREQFAWSTVTFEFIADPKIHIEGSSIIVPLNQYDRGISNEEIFEVIKNHERHY